MNFSTGESNYRGTDIRLPRNKSGRGSSKVEAVHSVVGHERSTGMHKFIGSSPTPIAGVYQRWERMLCL